MSADKYVEVIKKSWLARLGGGFKGIFIGFIIFLISFPVLCLNEGNAIKNDKALKEGAEAVLSISCDSINPLNDGKIVHVYSMATTEDTLKDQQFGISENALKIKRNVTVYQWKEKVKENTEHKTGGSTETVKEYTYSKGWYSKLINSDGFKIIKGHENPEVMKYQSKKYTASNITLGAFTLPPSLVSKIKNYSPLPVMDENILPTEIRAEAKIYDGQIFLGNDPLNPRIGDHKVSFEIIKPSMVSIIAAQIYNTFEPYVTGSGKKIELLQPGTHSADVMFADAISENTMKTWRNRGIGLLLMFVGLLLFLRPIYLFADFLPILGRIVKEGLLLNSISIALILSSIIVGISWLGYRPLIGSLFLIGAIGFIILLKFKPVKLKAGDYETVTSVPLDDSDSGLSNKLLEKSNTDEHMIAAKFDDPIANKCGWTPAKGGGASFCTNKLKQISPFRIEFRATYSVIIFSIGSLLIGLGVIALFIKNSYLEKTSIWSTTGMLVILCGLVFSVVGGFLLYYYTKPIVFDKNIGLFWKGRRRPQTTPYYTYDNAGANLNQIYAIQVISEFIGNHHHNSKRSGSKSYEINLVLKDGERINVVDHGKRGRIREDARILAGFLGVPIWDAT